MFDVFRGFHSHDKGKPLSVGKSNRRLPFFQIFFSDLFSEAKGESSFVLPKKSVTRVSLSLDYPCSSMKVSGSFRPEVSLHQCPWLQVKLDFIFPCLLSPPVCFSLWNLSGIKGGYFPCHGRGALARSDVACAEFWRQHWEPDQSVTSCVFNRNYWYFKACSNHPPRFCLVCSDL